MRWGAALVVLVLAGCDPSTPPLSAEPATGTGGRQVGSGGATATGSGGQVVSGGTGSGGQAAGGGTSSGGGSASAGPTVVVAACDRVATDGTRYAEAAFPGKSGVELAALAAVPVYDAPDGGGRDSLLVRGYPGRTVSGVSVRDGAAAIHCFPGWAQVRLILP